MYVYVFVYKHELMISLKEDHLMTLKESRWICVSVWREKRKVTDILIIYISKFSEEDILLQLQHMFANWHDQMNCNTFHSSVLHTLCSYNQAFESYFTTSKAMHGAQRHSVHCWWSHGHADIPFQDN